MDARPRLLKRVRDYLRKLHYNSRTEQQYLFWIRRFILFHGKRHPSDRAAREVEDFLTHLGGRPESVGLDAEPGACGDPVPLTEGLAGPVAVVRRQRAGETVPLFAGCPDVD